jgi:hypothetical protein
MALQVIGTGWGRTGMDSMREALTILGFGPCHHMFEINASPALRDAWRALAKGASPDWEMLFAGYRSCMDWPSAFYWRELIALYPKARVILTARPAAEWWDSYAKTILQAIGSNPDPDSLVHTLVAARQLQGRPADRDHVIGLYEAHVAEVLSTVPADRLLVHRPGDGWAPLCAHLGVAVPDQPYPNRNATAAIQAQFGLKPAS